MFKDYQHTKRNMLLAIILYLVLGVILLIWPAQFIQVACNIIGAIMIAFGVVTVIGELTRRNRSVIMVMLSVLVAAIGIVIIANPALVTSIIPVTFGLILIMDGIVDISQSIGMHRYKESTWAAMLIMGIITIVLGGIILLHPYGTAQLAFRILGAALIFSGLSDFFIVHHVGRAAKKYVDKDGVHDIIDVESRPVDDDE